MIKINLVKTGKKNEISSPVNLSIATTELGGANQLQKQALSRILLFLVGPIGLYVYFYIIQFPDLTNSIRKYNDEAQTLRTQNEKATQAREAAKSAEEETRKTNEKIAIIDKLKAGRLAEVKILDTIQKSIPPKVWLSKLELRNGKVTIQGKAIDGSSVTAFEDTLRSSIFLKDVITQRVGETIVGKNISGKEFNIDCAVETGIKDNSNGGASGGTK